MEKEGERYTVKSDVSGYALLFDENAGVEDIERDMGGNVQST